MPHVTASECSEVLREVEGCISCGAHDVRVTRDQDFRQPPRLAMLRDMDGRIYSHIAIALGAAWAVLAFMWGPVLTLVQPAPLAISGVLFAIAIAVGIVSHRLNWEGALDMIAPLAMGLACGVLQPAIYDVAVAQSANSRRCEAIQKDMLSARPRRSDSVDLFQALGCRPQGQGNVYAPPVRKASGRLK